MNEDKDLTGCTAAEDAEVQRNLCAACDRCSSVKASQVSATHYERFCTLAA